MPSNYDSYRYDPIPGLIMEQGRIAAEGAQRSGDIWANAIGNVGQQVGSAVQQYGQQQEQSKRSKAVDQLFSGPEPPQPQDILRVFGPKDGLDVIKGLQAIHPKTPAETYTDRMERIRDAALGVKALPEDKRQSGWDLATQGLLAAKVITPEEAQSYNLEHLDQLASYGQKPKGPEAPIKGAPGDVFFDPKDFHQLGSVPKEAKPESRTIDEQLAAAKIAGDAATYSQLLDVKKASAAAGRDPAAQAMASELGRARLDALKGGKLVKVEHKDPATGRTVIEWLPQNQLAGQKFEKGLGMTAENRVTSAQVVNETGDEIISQLKDPKFAATVGPVLGRYTNLQEFIGNPPPEYAELAGQIESYALANMGVHGMRSAKGAADIKAFLSAKHTPESMIAAINGLNRFSEKYMAAEGRPTGKPAQASGGPVKVSTPEEARKLAPGTLFETPDGQIKVR